MEAKELEIGKIYSGIGYCGMTKYIEVTGKLISANKMHNGAEILCEKRNVPCAVWYKSLKKRKYEN
ncbi:TPA: hypothetical protein ACGZ9C_003127 [Elizabethkingia anophelis]